MSPAPRRAAARQDEVARVARAVLYEGFLLWPYRRSALRHRQRWSFGGVHPRAWCTAHRSGERWYARVECLLETGTDCELELEARFLHVVRRRVAELKADGPRFVDALDAGGRRVPEWDEAAERVVSLGLAGPEERRDVAVDVPAGVSEELLEVDGGAVGLVERSWEPVLGALCVRGRRVAPGLVRLRVALANTTPFDDGARQDALRRSFACAHLVLRARGGRFVSLSAPPAALRAEAARCRNTGLWPALVDQDGARDTLLASPLSLPDHPELVGEGRGELLDATEVERLLVLSLLAMDPGERREVEAQDPRARGLLERTRALAPDALRRLHDAVRELRPPDAPAR